MKKLVSVTVSTPSNRGGAEIVWDNLAKAGLKFENVSLESPKIPKYLRAVPSVFHLREVFASKWLLKKALSKDPDVLFYDKIFGWQKIKTSAKKICYNHGSYTIAGLAFRKRNYPVYLFYRYILYWFEKKSYMNADKIIAVSDSVKREMVNFFHISPEKISVIGNAIDLKKFRPLKEKGALRKIYGLPGGKRLLFFPGRPSYGKGFDIVEKVSRILGEDYAILVLGRGSSKEKNIRFIGKVDNEKMPEIYNCADACVFPSRYEGSSVSVLESAACGVPLILSETGEMQSHKEMREFIADTPLGYAKKIGELFKGDNMRKASKIWRKFSRAFSLSNQINDIECLLDENKK